MSVIEEGQVAFEQLKIKILSTIMLHHPDMSKPFYLQKDSSGVGLAGVLFQYDEDGKMKICIRIFAVEP